MNLKTFHKRREVILNDDSSEIGSMLNNLLGYSVEEPKDLREQAKKDCKYYLKESPDDRTPTEWGAYIDTPLFAAYFLLGKGDEFMSEVWPVIEKEASE